jgi:hypothetical protein
VRKRRFLSTRTTRTTLKGIEWLESRRVLAATADIIFIVDESGSTTDGGSGEAIRFWAKEIVGELEAKLIGRGIGVDNPNTGTDEANRYGLIAFGDASVEFDSLSRSLMVGGQLFGNAAELELALDGLQTEQPFAAEEDAWDGIGRSVTSPFVQPLSNYEFRPNAAVHLIVISDDERTREVPNEELLFFDLLDEFRHENLNTNDPTDPLLRVLNDAVVTVVADFQFDLLDLDGDGDSGNPEEPPVFGIDVHALDNVNLDLNSENPDDDIMSQDDEFVIFIHQEGPGTDDDIIVAEVRKGPDEGMLLIDRDDEDIVYQDVRTAFEFDYDPTVDPDDDFRVIGQNGFEAEPYAFLSWEARGTTWDSAIIRDEQNYDSSNNEFRDTEQIRLFNRAFVDDTFEKIKLQVADFDTDGRITSDDIDALLDLTVNYMPENPPNNQQLADFDLDGTGQVDHLDAGLLLGPLLQLWKGDANADGQFDGFDITQVVNNYMQEATWSSGDWDDGFDNFFGQIDLVEALQDDGYFAGFNPEMVPVWGDINDASIYFPDWSDGSAPPVTPIDIRASSLGGITVSDFARILKGLRGLFSQSPHESPPGQGNTPGNNGNGPPATPPGQAKKV